MSLFQCFMAALSGYMIAFLAYSDILSKIEDFVRRKLGKKHD